MTSSRALPLVYTAQSKQFYYCRDSVCEFVLRRGAVPLHPFRAFGYFLDDRVDRDVVRTANDVVVRRVDEIWVFGEALADGVLHEIELARSLGKPVRFFSIATRASDIVELSLDDLTCEQELVDQVSGDIRGLRAVVRGGEHLSALLT
jgi:hypothetical protein